MQCVKRVLRGNGSPGYFDSRLQVFYIVESGLSSSSLKYPTETVGVQIICPTLVIELQFGTFGSVGRCQGCTVDQRHMSPKSPPTVETSHWTSLIMGCVPLNSSSRLWDLDWHRLSFRGGLTQGMRLCVTTTVQY